MFHEAKDIRVAKLIDHPDDHVWIATHVGCGGDLYLSNSDWKCSECEESFHDDHCADLAAEKRDRAARELAANVYTDTHDEKLANRGLEEERHSIRQELVNKRIKRAEARMSHVHGASSAARKKTIAAG